MTALPRQMPFGQRVDETPSLDPGKVREVGWRPLGYRFATGAATSVASGVLAIAFDARVGGVMLAFPAILAASLTLIAKEEDKHHAREDARGAVLGGCGMAAFAGVCALAFGHWSAAVVLVLATVAWAVVALGGYLLLWFRRPRSGRR